MKHYIREGRRFVALPDPKDYIGKWVDTNTDKLSTNKPEHPLGLCVDVEGTDLILITDIVGPSDFKSIKNICTTSIDQLFKWRNEIRSFTKALVNKFNGIGIWSNSFCYQNSDYSNLYCLSLDSDYCGVGYIGVGSGYCLFALKTKTFPISKLSK